MTVRPISRTTLLAVIVAITAALFGRSWLQVYFLDGGMDSRRAADLSYLLVPVILALLLFPLWPSQKRFLAAQFRSVDISCRVVLRALAIGIILRVVAWCELVAGVSFGFYRSNDPDAIVGPSFSFQCGPVEVVLLGFLVMVVLVPLIEEVVNRAYLMSAIRHRGFAISVLTSALFFTVFHPSTSWPFVFLAGLVLGTQYWITRSLWPSLISHATVNGVIQFDWYCLSGKWNPTVESLPVLAPGLLAIIIFTCCVAALIALFRQTATEASDPPR